MKIITSIKDIDTLVKGDQYIIQPIGYDLQQPEKLINFQKEIDDIQKAVESKFSSIIDVIKDAAYFANKYTSAKIKAVAKSIGVKTTGTEIQVAEFILAKISADEFEKLLFIERKTPTPLG